MNNGMSPIPKETLEALRKSVRAHGGQVRFAARAGVSQSQISKLLRGHNVMADTAAKVFAAMGGLCAPGCELARAAEPAPVDYEAECLRLKHELADHLHTVAAKERELAALERQNDEAWRQLGHQQDKIMRAVQIMARRLGLDDDQSLQLTDAVGNYELVLAEEEAGGPIKSHRHAAGE